MINRFFYKSSLSDFLSDSIDTIFGKISRNDEGDSAKEQKKIARWETICKEASEQSHRVTIPQIHNIMTMKELLNQKQELNLICSLNDETKPLEEYLNKEIKSILFIIGPEGGFSKKEEDFLIENGFKATTLGKRVLRVETAAIYVASIINYIYKG